MNQPVNFELRPVPGYEKQAQLFANDYDLVDIILQGESNKESLPPAETRVCRFCGCDSTLTTFNDFPHLISKLLGNDALYSDSECDACNRYFGTHEDHLTNYLGIARSLMGSSSYFNSPGFASARNELMVKPVTIDDDEFIVVSRENIENGRIIVDAESGSITCKFKKNSFRPLRVYKAMLKIALSILPASVVKEKYSKALQLLMSSEPQLLSGCLMSGYALPLQYTFPAHVYLFRKKHAAISTHTHVMALYAHNYILALPVPAHKDDLFFHRPGETTTINLYPPFFSQFTYYEQMELRPFSQDFSSDEKMKGLEDELHIAIDPENLRASVAYDGKTGTYSEGAFAPSEIRQIIIHRKGGGVDPKKLFEVINKKK